MVHWTYILMGAGAGVLLTLLVLRTYHLRDLHARFNAFLYHLQAKTPKHSQKGLKTALDMAIEFGWNAKSDRRKQVAPRAKLKVVHDDDA